MTGGGDGRKEIMNDTLGQALRRGMKSGMTETIL